MLGGGGGGGSGHTLSFQVMGRWATDWFLTPLRGSGVIPASPAHGPGSPILYFAAALGKCEIDQVPSSLPAAGGRRPARRSVASFVHRLLPYLHAHFLIADGGDKVSGRTSTYLKTDMRVRWRLVGSIRAVNQLMKIIEQGHGGGKRTEGGRMTTETRHRETDKN